MEKPQLMIRPHTRLCAFGKRFQSAQGFLNIEAQAEKWQGGVTPPQTSVVAPALEQVGNKADVRQTYALGERFRSLCDDAGTRSTFAIQLLSNP